MKSSFRLPFWAAKMTPSVWREASTLEKARSGAKRSPSSVQVAPLSPVM